MKPIAKHVCNYAVLQFQPYLETGEFVNLGVAVHCAERGLLDIQMEHRKLRRVTDFFPELDRKQFQAAREAVAAEFDRVKQLAAHAPEVETGRHVFRELVRQRESIFRFGEVRTILTNEPGELTGQLFERYVLRNFAKQKEYQETVMARHFLQVLREHCLGRPFHGQFTIRGKLYHVRVPIHSEQMRKPGELVLVPARVIKPLDLDKDDPTAIIDHGDAWIARVKRLAAMKLAPDRFIFAARIPQRANADLKAAVEEVICGLEAAGGIVVSAYDTQRLVKAAADDEEVGHFLDA